MDINLIRQARRASVEDYLKNKGETLTKEASNTGSESIPGSLSQGTSGTTIRC